MLLFLFLDGVGLGGLNIKTNPFLKAKTPFLNSLINADLTKETVEQTTKNFLFRHLDARLGYEGLPQSATGQTALLTGKNGAQIMKGHYGPWPGPSLKKELIKGTLFSDFGAENAQLCNVYPPGFFRALERGKQKQNVPVYAAQQAGVRLLELSDYMQKNAISLDLTGDYLNQLDARNEILEPYQMGVRLAKMAQKKQFSFFDYWPSDQVGHRGDFAEAVSLIEKLDSFMQGVAENLLDVSLLVSSDHGNLEDKSVKTHTKAAVPLLVLGSAAKHFEAATSILHVPASIRSFLKP